MKTIYVADDGKSFDNEFDCEMYEFILNHPHLKDVHIYNDYGVEREDLLSDETYFCADTIIVSTQDALNDLHSLAKYMGHLSYEDIDSIGRWVYNQRQETFVKVN